MNLRVSKESMPSLPVPRDGHILPSQRKFKLLLGLALLTIIFKFLISNPLETFVRFPESKLDFDIFPDNEYPLRSPSQFWDISTSYPYPRTFEKEVSEGTWLRIAAHPTQNEIVFDMLGDLYCMRLDNPEDGRGNIRAHPFLRGVPYDKEPSFSADGHNIVFTSDSGFGIDNIWTLPYSSCEILTSQTAEFVRSSAIQHTNSTFRFFSSPAFHPTLPKIIATKWFLTGRPNGAGELWEFPLRKKSQKIDMDNGHRVVARKLPASWPKERYGESQLGAEQGRYVGRNGDGIVFTRNVRDDDTGLFSYNKDVHKGINAVFLYNTTTGTTEQLVDAKPGGANMPRVSHDGRSLAFVRRVKEKSVLVLKSLSSGTLHYVWKELTYDVSLIPAFMGAYPNFDFSANDSSIIIWSSGHIYEVPLKLNSLGERVAGDVPRVIPFKAKINLSLGNTRYSETDTRKVELADEGYVHALRGLRSDWDGRHIVFEGAGDIFSFDIKTQDMVPLPKLEPSAQYYAPSIGRDPSHIIVARWSDTDLTIFEQIHLSTGQIKVIDGIPRGRYISPVVGCGKIAFIRTGADYMFGDVQETSGQGIWLGDLTSDPATNGSVMVTNLQRLDSYSAEDAKLEFKHTYSEKICTNPTSTILQFQSAKLVKDFNMDGEELGISASGKTTMEMTVGSLFGDLTTYWSKIQQIIHPSSAKDMVVAFKDFQHIWIAFATRDTLENLWSKPGDTTTPKHLVRLSQDGGHDVTFSGDGKMVFWLSGPHLWYASVSDIRQRCAFAGFSLRDSGECAASVAKTTNLTVHYETDVSKLKKESGGRAVAFVNATIVPMDPQFSKVIKNGTVVIRGGEIIAMGTDILIPKNSHIVPVSGGVILPGFVDVHGHWGGFLSQYPSTSWELEAFMGYGVTTIHNPSSKNVGGYVERTLVEKGAFYGPRIYHTGDVLYGSTRSDCYTEIHSAEEARAALMRVKVEGGPSSFSVKNYQLQPRSARQRLLLEAEKLNMIVVPEGGWSLDWDITYFIDGMTTLEHPVPIPELFDDVLSLIAASGTSYTQVAVMNYGGLFGQNWVHQNNDIPENPKLRKYVKHDILEMLTEVKQAPHHSYQFFNATISVKKLADAGVRTNIGAHGEQPIGFLFHSEMEIHALGGQTPYQVFRAATLDGATSLGLNSSVGSITPGKLADLVIYGPGIDTIDKAWKNSRDMLHVIRGGRIFNVSDGMVEVWPRVGRSLSKGRINPEDES